MPQSDSFLVASIDGVSSEIHVLKFDAEEWVSRLFHFRLEVASADENLDPGDVVRKAILVTISTGSEGDRYFHGLVRRLSLGGRLNPGRSYIVDVVPKLWLLTKRADCRIFQNLTAPDIVKQVLQGAGLASGDDFNIKLTGTYVTREYCVQYRETDFQFISRLLEEEGIFYYFEHAESSHKLIISDDNGTFAACGEAEGNYWPIEAGAHPVDRIIGWQYATQLRSGKFTLRDYNFIKPTLLLESSLAGSLNSDLEVYDYPGLYELKADGDARAGLRLPAETRDTQVAVARSSYRTFTAGGTFTLKGHDCDSFNAKYVITSIAHSATADGEKYENRFEAIPASVTYRPDVVTPKPLIGGVQTALVVGPSGEEIYPDQYGRIKVQFYWDRLGNKDDKSSCWIRCAQPWASAAWGAGFIPRIDDEVVVTFLEGNPDRPLVIGSVYHATNVTAYQLPDEKTKSYLKSNTSKGGAGSNELRFEDKKSSEEIYIHAQKDLNTVVENDETLTVGSSNAADGSQTISIYKNRTLTVQTGNESMTIQKGNRTVEIDQGNDSLTIKQGNRTVEIDQGNDTLTIKQGNLSIQMSAGSGTVEAAEKITLKVGSNSIEIAQSGITVKGAMIQVSADATLALKGGVVNIN